MVARLLFDVSRQDCRWPTGTDEVSGLMLFCGEPAKAGGPYCRCHARLAFRPRPPRRMAPKPAAAAYVSAHQLELA
jgi:GcrA cell cycle regulator